MKAHSRPHTESVFFCTQEAFEAFAVDGFLRKKGTKKMLKKASLNTTKTTVKRIKKKLSSLDLFLAFMDATDQSVYKDSSRQALGLALRRSAGTWRREAWHGSRARQQGTAGQLARFLALSLILFYAIVACSF